MSRIAPLLILVLLSACAPSEAAIQAAIEQTAAAAPTITSPPATSAPTEASTEVSPAVTPSPTPWVFNTAGPTITSSPASTNTPTPRNTSTPAPEPETKEIGPILDSLSDETFTIAVTLKSWLFFHSIDFYTAKAGQAFLSVSLTVSNRGPGSALSIAPYHFQVLDGDGVVRDYGAFHFALTCAMETVALRDGGSIDGCVGFEVPAEGHLELIYAPYQYDQLEEGRYLSFVIRE